MAEITGALTMLPPVIFPDTDKLVNVPTDVIFGCAAVVTVPAVVAVVAVPTVSDDAVPVNPVPAPVKLDAVTAPDALITPVTYSPVVANVATAAVPPTPTVTLPLLVAMFTLLVPLLMFAPPPPPPDIPVNNEPLPTK